MSSTEVAVLGPKGTYTHQAAEEYFEEYEPVFCSSIQQIVDSDADAAVIPFENSLAGGVGGAIDILKKSDAEVTGEHLLSINHVLASGEESIEDIEKVKSHPQALGQCRDIIEKEGWEEFNTSSTAKAAEELGEKEAVICSRLAAELNDLNILEEGIQDNNSNTTRFFILDNGEEEGEKTSVIMDPSVDYPGLLGAMLSCFSGHGINLSYIQSRPTQDELGNYYFYVEAETDKDAEDFQDAKKCLETYADVKVLGSYSKGEKK